MQVRHSKYSLLLNEMKNHHWRVGKVLLDQVASSCQNKTLAFSGGLRYSPNTAGQVQSP